MLEDQKNQLLIHAEAVKRLEQRGRLMASERECESASVGSSSSSSSASSESKSNSSSSANLSSAGSSVVKVSSTTAAAVAASTSSLPSGSSALASASSSSQVNSASAALQPPAHSWTQRPEFQSAASLLSPGRKKYGTIIKAALRFLHSLKPKSVNRSGGSHIVFHFHTGAPVTLVTPHSGGSKDSTKSSSYCTRLYATLHEAALQQFNPPSRLTSTMKINSKYNCYKSSKL